MRLKVRTKVKAKVKTIVMFISYDEGQIVSILFRFYLKCNIEIY